MTKGPGSKTAGEDFQAGRVEGELETLREQVVALEAADEHRRAELSVAQAEAAEARALARELRARLEERQHLVETLQERLSAAEADKARAEKERAAVISCLGWRAKRRLGTVAEEH